MGDREPASLPPGRPEHDIEDYQRGNPIIILKILDTQIWTNRLIRIYTVCHSVFTS